jgi:hypothetical protein
MRRGYEHEISQERAYGLAMRRLSARLKRENQELRAEIATMPMEEIDKLLDEAGITEDVRAEQRAEMHRRFAEIRAAEEAKRGQG